MTAIATVTATASASIATHYLYCSTLRLQLRQDYHHARDCQYFCSPRGITVTSRSHDRDRAMPREQLSKQRRHAAADESMRDPVPRDARR